MSQTIAQKHTMSPTTSQTYHVDEDEPLPELESAQPSGHARRWLILAVIAAVAAVGIWQGYIRLMPRAKIAEGRQSRADGGENRAAKRRSAF